MRFLEGLSFDMMMIVKSKRKRREYDVAVRVVVVFSALDSVPRGKATEHPVKSTIPMTPVRIIVCRPKIVAMLMIDQSAFARIPQCTNMLCPCP